MKRPLLLSLVLFFLVSNIQATLYITQANGNWGDPNTWTTWTGALPPSSAPITGPTTYVSSFFPTPVAGGNWFTGQTGDTIVIRHTVTMDYNIFIRDSDVVVIDTTGILNSSATHGQFLNLSSGMHDFLYDTIDAGLHVLGQMNVEYIRNSGRMNIEAPGAVNVTEGSLGSGDFDNFGNLYVAGQLYLNNGNFNHNAGDIYIFPQAYVEVNGNGSTGGNWNNRSVIRNLHLDACIRTQGGSFNNLIGGSIVGLGHVNASVNIDNSANPLASWNFTTWCAGGTALNIPPGLEDCTLPCSTILPSTVTNFSGVVQYPDVLLEWLSEGEILTDFFILERKIEGGDYQKIAQLATLNQSGKITINGGIGPCTPELTYTV